MFLVNFDTQMPRNQIRQTRRFLGVGNCAKRLFRNVFLDLGIALKLIPNRAQQRFDGGGVAGDFVQVFSGGFKENIVFQKVIDLHPCLTFNKHLHGAIGQFQQLQHIGQHTRAVNAFGFRIVLSRVNLAGQQNLFVVLHHFF